jgi:hypothetical protein
MSRPLYLKINPDTGAIVSAHLGDQALDAAEATLTQTSAVVRGRGGEDLLSPAQGRADCSNRRDDGPPVSPTLLDAVASFFDVEEEKEPRVQRDVASEIEEFFEEE